MSCHTTVSTRREWKRRLVKLLSQVVWGFRDFHHTAPASAETLVNVRVDKNYPPYTAMIAIGIETLETMLNLKTTLGELCVYQVDLALTVSQPRSLVIK
jgi:hypothetical protein